MDLLGISELKREIARLDSRGRDDVLRRIFETYGPQQAPEPVDEDRARLEAAFDEAQQRAREAEQARQAQQVARINLILDRLAVYDGATRAAVLAGIAQDFGVYPSRVEELNAVPGPEAGDGEASDDERTLRLDLMGQELTQPALDWIAAQVIERGEETVDLVIRNVSPKQWPDLRVAVPPTEAAGNGRETGACPDPPPDTQTPASEGARQPLSRDRDDASAEVIERDIVNMRSNA